MTYEEVTTGLDDLSGWGRAAFALGCAERASPLPSRLGQTQVASLFRAGLATASERISGLAPPGAVRSAASGLESFFEAAADGERSVRLDLAIQALSVLSYALDALRADEDPQPAKWASAAALDLAANVDSLLEDDSPRTVAFDPRNLPPPGAHEAREMSAQQETLRLLKSPARPEAELLAALLGLSREASRRLDLGLVEVCRRAGWDCDPSSRQP